jgi:lipopolysaccharide transport system permease protein
MSTSESSSNADLIRPPIAERAALCTSPVTIIGPSNRGLSVNFRELWDYREMLFFLTWRDVKVRYKQTVLGAAWAVIQPFCTMVVFSVFFGNLAHIPSEGVPYPIFAYSALVPWTYFATALTQATNSLVTHERVITKVYFPRLILPISSVLGGLLDFAIAFVVLIGMMLIYGVTPTAAILTAPLFALLATATALAVGVWLSALNVRYRDIRYATPFLVQFWLFITPIAYPSSIVPDAWRTVYGLNPLVGVVEGFRWALLGVDNISTWMLLASTLAVAFLMVSGIYYFQRTERIFADVV